MKKIVDFEICDIVPYSNGIIFAKKEMLDDNRCKVTFYGYDIKEQNRFRSQKRLSA